MGRHIEISDTRLWVEERGADGLPLLVFHGGPALDHRMFGDYLDPLADEFRLVLVDQRSQGRSDPAPVETWTLERMAADAGELAEAMGFERYASLGHSYGASGRGTRRPRSSRAARRPRAGSRWWRRTSRASSRSSCASR